jgi:hypothetical protein
MVVGMTAAPFIQDFINEGVSREDRQWIDKHMRFW